MLPVDQDLKCIEFGEAQLHDLQGLAGQLFEDSHDPRSYAYKRILIRPKICWWKIILHCAAAPVLWAGLYLLLRRAGLGFPAAALLPSAVLILCLLLCAKQIAVALVRIYQRYAPDHIRNKCRFEPSCSQYMILALEKYGFWKGLPKGISRLRRCNLRDGGYDEP